MAAARHTGLIRAIGRWDLVALVINGVIGAGIFGLPAKVFALTGGYSLLAYIACAAVMGVITLCMAEVTTRFTATGGPYRVTHEAFGPAAGFVIGWLLYLTRLTAFATIANVFVTYLAGFWPAVGAGTGRAALVTALVATLTALNLVGIRQTATANNLFALGKLAPLLLFAVLGLAVTHHRSLALGAPPALSGFAQAILMLVFAFGGAESVVIATGEMREPRRDLPFALFAGLGFVAALYVLIQWVCIVSLPDLAHSERPLADAARALFGAGGAALVTLGALISTAGTLNGVLLVAPRVAFAMAEHCQLPGPFAAVHPRFATPHVALFVTAVLVWGATIASTFTSALALNVLTRVLVYAAMAAALPVLRRRDRDGPASFRTPAAAVVVPAALVGCAWLLTGVRAREARDVGVAVAVGAGLYLASRAGRRPRPSIPTEPLRTADGRGVDPGPHGSSAGVPPARTPPSPAPGPTRD